MNQDISQTKVNSAKKNGLGFRIGQHFASVIGDYKLRWRADIRRVRIEGIKGREGRN